MTTYNLTTRLQKMSKYAHSIERGNKALRDFMYEACKMIHNHAEDAKKALQIDNDIEKGLIKHFFPLKKDEKSCEKQRRNMYIRALRKLTSAETLRDAKKMLDEKGVYALSRNNKNEGVDSSSIFEQVDGEFNDEQEDVQDIQPLTKKKFKTHLKQKNAFKKFVVILKESEENGYVAIVNKSIHEKICELMEEVHVKQIQLFDEG